MEIGEDLRKGNTILIFREGKKPWELQADQTYVAPWENHRFGKELSFETTWSRQLALSLHKTCPNLNDSEIPWNILL